MSNTTIQAQVPAVRAGEGDARWWWGGLAILRRPVRRPTAA